MAVARATSGAEPIETIASDIRGRLDELTLELTRTDKDSSFNDVFKRTAKRLMSMANTGGKGAMPTGFDRLDTLIGGLSPMLMVVAARPGMGKTSFATCVSVNVASRADEGHIAMVSTKDIKTGPRHVKWLQTLEVRLVND